jgi:copper(I)-binding protein
MGERAAMYFTVQNGGDQDDQLLAITTTVAGAAEIHRTFQDGGMVRMEPVASLDVPAGGLLRLAPGGYHVMLLDLQEHLWAGDRFDATLHFRHAGEIAVRARVVELADIEEALAESS